MTTETTDKERLDRYRALKALRGLQAETARLKRAAEEYRTTPISQDQIDFFRIRNYCSKERGAE